MSEDWRNTDAGGLLAENANLRAGLAAANAHIAQMEEQIGRALVHLDNGDVDQATYVLNPAPAEPPVLGAGDGEATKPSREELLQLDKNHVYELYVQQFQQNERLRARIAQLEGALHAANRIIRNELSESAMINVETDESAWLASHDEAIVERCAKIVEQTSEESSCKRAVEQIRALKGKP